ncbi:hypothetical protein [Haloplanus rubicundus]|jgi:hypothetical protein|nr:hypothetical protein [Haloplanus rubicundus]
MCHPHKPIDRIAERYADAVRAEDEADEADTEPEAPTLTPPADD